MCFACRNYNVVLICHVYTNIHKRTQTYIHIHTDLNFAIFWKDRKIKYTCNWDNTGPRNLIQAKFEFFNENIRSKKDSGQIEGNKLKYLHYLNKMIEKCRVKKFIFSEVSCFYSEILWKIEPFQRIISKVLPKLWMAAFELCYIVNSFSGYFSFGSSHLKLW